MKVIVPIAVSIALSLVATLIVVVASRMIVRSDARTDRPELPGLPEPG